VRTAAAHDRDASDREASDPDPARRLHEGMGLAVADKGYSATTIADVVRHARVSKRTFYEHYPDKEACFLATYQAMSNELLERVAQAAAASALDGALEAAVRSYFASLDERRRFVRGFLSEVHAAGPSALALRRKIHLKFAALLRTAIDRAREHGAEVTPLTPELSIALIGGINELVLSAVERGQRGTLSTLAPTAIALIRAVIEPR
jgi:AcrR family transcriptional regulator